MTMLNVNVTFDQNKQISALSLSNHMLYLKLFHSLREDIHVHLGL